jgi:hypothetical protein
MPCNLLGCIYGRSSVNIAHFVPIHLQTWPPQATLVSDCLIFSSHQVSVYLAQLFQRRIFKKNQPIRNKIRLWWPCLLTDRDEMSKISVKRKITRYLYSKCSYLYTDNWIELQIYASKTPQPNELKLGRNHLWKVLYKDCSFRQKSTNQKQELPVAAKFVNGSGRKEQSL